MNASYYSQMSGIQKKTTVILSPVLVPLFQLRNPALKYMGTDPYMFHTKHHLINKTNVFIIHVNIAKDTGKSSHRYIIDDSSTTVFLGGFFCWFVVFWGFFWWFFF